MIRVASAAALTAVVLACGAESLSAQDGAYPQPIVQAASCPSCQSGLPPAYIPPIPGASIYRPHDPWSTAGSPPPQIFTGYAGPETFVSGWYVGGITGVVFLDDQKSEAINPNIAREIRAAYDWEATGGGIIGYRFPYHPRDLGQLRFEFETMFRQNDIKTLWVNGIETPASGQVFANSFMFNVALDLVPMTDWLVPYIGGGVGVVRVQHDLAHGAAEFNDSDAAFGYQGMAGASIRLWKNVELFTEFRFMGVSNPKLLHIDPNSQPQRARLRSQYDTYQILSGLRLTLY